jgi:hypothetical protein
MMPAAVPLLLEAAVRALLAACVLWAGLRALRVRNVPAQKIAWGLVLAAALAMPLLMRWQWLPAWAEVKLPAPAWPLVLDSAPAPQIQPPVAAASLAASEALPVQAPGEADRFSAPVISLSQFDAPAQPETTPEPAAMPAPAAPQPASAPRTTLSPGRLLRIGWFVYLGIGAALLLRLLFGLGSSLRLWMLGKPVEAGPEFEWPRGLRVRSSRRVASPVNIGSGILLPADYAQWDAEKLRVVLAHERSHVRQRDFYLQLLAGLYAALIWFSPLGWWLKRKLSELGEAISDRAGLEAAASPSAYAELLLEFAALPRPTLTGVAMAHSTNLSERIERLLNDTSFRQAFTGSRRALAAVLLVPVALIAATALVRVQAAEVVVARPSALLQGGEQSPQAVPPQAAATGQSHPDNPQVRDSGSGQSTSATPQPNPAPAPAPAPPSSDGTAPMPAAQEMAPVPPTPPAADDAAPAAAPVPPVPPQAPGDAVPSGLPAPPAPGAYHYHFDYHYDGDTYAIVGDPGTNPRFYGYWDDDRKAEIEKARSLAHGHFLWFRHDGKSYIVDDPAIVAQIETMDKPMQDLGAQMRDLGKQMREVSQQDREMARKAREASQNIPTPDISKEMAELNTAAAALQAQQGGTISRQQLGELERKIGDVQRQLMRVQVKVDVNWSADMGKFGAEQGKFGAQMGQMGAEMGRIARENSQKIKSIIDESLKDGKARPVE